MPPGSGALERRCVEQEDAMPDQDPTPTMAPEPPWGIPDEPSPIVHPTGPHPDDYPE